MAMVTNSIQEQIDQAMPRFVEGDLVQISDDYSTMTMMSISIGGPDGSGSTPVPSEDRGKKGVITGSSVGWNERPRVSYSIWLEEDGGSTSWFEESCLTLLEHGRLDLTKEWKKAWLQKEGTPILERKGRDWRVERYNPIEMIKGFWPEASTDHITFDPDLRKGQYNMIRQGGGDGAHMYTLETMAETLVNIANGRSFFSPTEPTKWEDVHHIEYTVGPFQISTVYGTVLLGAGRFPGSKFRTRMPVICRYVMKEEIQ